MLEEADDFLKIHLICGHDALLAKQMFVILSYNTNIFIYLRLRK